MLTMIVSWLHASLTLCERSMKSKFSSFIKEKSDIKAFWNYN